jgi:hypothetical protein
MTNFKDFIRRAQLTQKTIDAMTHMHRIEVQLNDNEYNALTLMCAMATAAAFQQGDRGLAKMFITVTNRLHESDPNWTPYDEKAIAKIAVTRNQPKQGK